MNKSDVVEKVSQQTGIEPDVCRKVISALDKVLQDELTAKGGMGALGKIAGFLNHLTAKKEDEA